MIDILHCLLTLGNYGIFLIMGNAGLTSSINRRMRGNGTSGGFLLYTVCSMWMASRPTLIPKNLHFQGLISGNHDKGPTNRVQPFLKLTIGVNPEISGLRLVEPGKSHA